MASSGSFEFMSVKTYTPPSWASHLDPIPSNLISLAHLPTPIHRWNLPNLPPNTEVWLKRDDLSGMQLSGNKVRKLEFLMADAIAQRADSVITVGGIQSNHCRATAVAAKYLNLDPFLILRTSNHLVDQDPTLTGNLLVERLIGAQLHLISKEEYSQIGSVTLADLLKQKLINQGRNPYVIPVGGSNSLGTWGYIEAIREIEQQIQSGTTNLKFDDIVVACGSGASIAGLGLKYIHGLAARGVHYLHRPGPTLQDLGFLLLPELGQERAYISESLFTIIFLSFFLWTFHPFIFKTKKIYTVLIWCRVLSFLVAAQALRIVTFYSTQLPGPNYHCREGSPLATLPRPKSVAEVLLINFPHGVIYGCGDLIFSSHMIFTLVFVNTYQRYGTKRCIKQLGWALTIIQSFLIVASRKHYTVDVVVAWYTVNLVVFFIEKKLQEMPDRTAATLLLPLSTKDNKDGRNKEENHKLLNGNSVDPSDWRQRTQANGKIMEDGHAHHADSAKNGA